MGGGDFQIAQDPLSALNPADIEDITVLKAVSYTHLDVYKRQRLVRQN